MQFNARLLIVLFATSFFFCVPVNGLITAEGSFSPDPFPTGTGIVTGEMRVGVVFQQSGTITVTDGDTLRTKVGTHIAYMTATTGTVSISDSSWIAESAVFMANEFFGNAEVSLDNSTWDVESNMKIAHGELSIATVNVNSNSTWETGAGVIIAFGEEASGTITIDNGSWNAEAAIWVSGDYTYEGYGEGAIHVGPQGKLNSQYMMEVYPLGTIEVDGGIVKLAGETILNGTFHSTSTGSTVEIFAGEIAGGPGTVYVGSGVDFSLFDLVILFHPSVTPDPDDVYNVFDPLDTVVLEDALAVASSITTPPGWFLDMTDGSLSCMKFSTCVTGPGLAAELECQILYDYDQDTDVDLKDFAVYQDLKE